MERKLILFQGDSITDAGRNKTVKTKNMALGDGYVTMAASKICRDYPEYDVINRGVGGDRIADMYGRWQEDTLNIKYDLMSVLCGINDIGFGVRLGRGSDVERFEFIYDRMLYESKEANPDADLVLCQPFITRLNVTGTEFCGEFGNDIDENWDLWNGEMEKRAAVVLKLAKKYNAIYVPMWDALKEALKSMPPERLTYDCIHLTAIGNRVIADAWLEATKEYFNK